MGILAVNAGSSSLKFALYPQSGLNTMASPVLTGHIEGLEATTSVSMRYSVADGGTLGEAQVQALPVSAEGSTFQVALDALSVLVKKSLSDRPLMAVAHRVVHGGEWYRASVLVDEVVFQRLAGLSELAPLHQPHNLEGIRRFQSLYPNVPQVACFDTAFHASLPAQEYLFALPQAISQQGIRRYGFHGLSYQYLQSQLRLRSQRAEQRVVMAHLGNGASLCAMQAGQSVATTMGFSALEGLMMGTRSGAIDPGVLLYLMDHGMSSAELSHLLYKQSGLLGVSGVAADMRSLRSSQDPQAQLAINMFTHRVVREAGAMTACVKGLDVLVFTGGIGEHDAVLRQEVAQQLAYLGLHIDEHQNAKATGSEMLRIDAPGSQVEVWVIPTDEGRMAAQSALALVQTSASHQSA